MLLRQLRIAFRYFDIRVTKIFVTA